MCVDLFQFGNILAISCKQFDLQPEFSHLPLDQHLTLISMDLNIFFLCKICIQVDFLKMNLLVCWGRTKGLAQVPWDSRYVAKLRNNYTSCLCRGATKKLELMCIDLFQFGNILAISCKQYDLQPEFSHLPLDQHLTLISMDLNIFQVDFLRMNHLVCDECGLQLTPKALISH